MDVRKLFSLGLAVALIESISCPAHAELFKNFKTDGSIEARAFGIDNLTDRDGNADDYRSETNTRLMFGANLDLLDDVHARVLADRTSRYGDTGTKGVDLHTFQTTVLFDNAYVKVDKVFGAVDVTMGRQFYGDNQDLNIYFGPQNDDLLSVTSADLFRTDAMIADGWVKFQGIAGKTADATWPAPGTNTDTTLFGGEFGTDKLIPMGNLALYYYTAQTHAVKPPALGNNTLSVGGLRAGGDILAGLGYQAEFLQNFGRNNAIASTPGYGGNAYFLNLHYGRLYDNRPFRAHIEYGRGSDDFVAIAPGRRFGLIWGEHSFTGPSTINRGNGTIVGNATGLSNLKVLDAGIGVNPIEKLGVDLNAYRFQYDSSNGAAGAYTGGVSAGTEYDLIVSWKHSENVSFEANAATFQVGTSLQNPAPTGTSPITRLGADVKIKY